MRTEVGPGAPPDAAKPADPAESAQPRREPPDRPEPADASSRLPSGPAPPSPSSGCDSGPCSALFEVLHEDTDLLVLNKPAGLVCHPTKAGPLSSLIGRVRCHLGPDAAPHLVNRLDRETSGVVLVAKTLDAARELRRLWENRATRKLYHAIVHGHVATESGRIDAPLGKDLASRVAIKSAVRPDGAPALTEYRVLRRFLRAEGSFSLLEVRLRTGRKHQIRVHLAHIGHPVVGDKIYGGHEDDYLALVEDRLTDEIRRRLLLPCQALHAAEVAFRWRDGEWVFHAAPEQWFDAFLEHGSC
jgi:23S rRNA pseudouridine1911/1915/1917 synthase